MIAKKRRLKWIDVWRQLDYLRSLESSSETSIKYWEDQLKLIGRQFDWTPLDGNILLQEGIIVKRRSNLGLIYGQSSFSYEQRSFSSQTQSKLQHPKFKAENINIQYAWLNYTQKELHITYEQKLFKNVFITNQEIQNDKKNNFVIIRKQFLNLIVDQQYEQCHKRYRDYQQKCQIIINSEFQFYITYQVLYYHDLDVNQVNFKYGGILQNFSPIFVDLLNATYDITKVKDYPYEDLIEILKWSDRNGLSKLTVLVLSYILPILNLRDIFTIYGIIKYLDIAKRSRYQLFGYLGLLIAQNFEKFKQLIFSSSYSTIYLQNIEDVYKIFYHSFIISDKSVRVGLIEIFARYFYKRQNATSILLQLTQKLNSSFSKFYSIAQDVLQLEESNICFTAKFCDQQVFELNNDFDNNIKIEYQEYLIYERYIYNIIINEIDDNYVYITNTICSNTQCWKVIIIVDSDGYISLYFHNLGYLSNKNQQLINYNEDFIQLMMKSDNKFTHLFCSIEISGQQYEFSYAFCKNQYETIGLSNIYQLETDEDLEITLELTEIPLIGALLTQQLISNNNLEHLKNLNLPQQLQILNSNHLEVSQEEKILYYINSMWDKMSEQNKQQFLKILRIDQLIHKEQYTENQELNELIRKFKEYNVLYQPPREFQQIIIYKSYKG